MSPAKKGGKLGGSPSPMSTISSPGISKTPRKGKSPKRGMTTPTPTTTTPKTTPKNGTPPKKTPPTTPIAKRTRKSLSAKASMANEAPTPTPTPTPSTKGRKNVRATPKQAVPTAAENVTANKKGRKSVKGKGSKAVTPPPTPTQEEVATPTPTKKKEKSVETAKKRKSTEKLMEEVAEKSPKISITPKATPPSPKKAKNVTPTTTPKAMPPSPKKAKNVTPTTTPKAPFPKKMKNVTPTTTPKATPSSPKKTKKKAKKNKKSVSVAPTSSSDDVTSATTAPTPKRKGKIGDNVLALNAGTSETDMVKKAVKRVQKLQAASIAAKKAKSKRGIILLSHIPHGFYEDAMQGYFSQFGKVCKIRLARSKKTGKSKGYAFIEFEFEEVAKIVAEAMDGYLMYERLLKCELLPSTVNTAALFASRYIRESKYPKLGAREKAREAQNKPKTEKEQKEFLEFRMKKLGAQNEKWASLGLNYQYTPPTALNA